MIDHRHIIGFLSMLMGIFPLSGYSAQRESRLETVVVTATGYPQPGATLDLAWSNITGTDLDRTAALHLNEIFHRIPGTWISRGNGQEHLTAIRSPVLTGAGGCGSFFMAQDGIALRAAGFCNVNQLFDSTAELAGRIEVLRGPGTALFGSNAMHGVINILSPDVAADNRGSIRLESGPHQYQRLRLVQNWKLGSGGLRIAAVGSRDDGYKDDSGYDQQKINLKHEYADTELRIDTVFSATNLNQETAGFISGDDAYRDSELKKVNPNPEAFRDASSWRWHSAITRELTDSVELSITPYARVNEMQFLQHFLPWKAIEDNGQKSAGLRTSVKHEGVNSRLSAGLDAALTRAYLKEFQPAPFSPAQPQGQHYDYNVDAGELAAYAQYHHAVSTRWSYDIGARMELSQYDYDNHLSDGSACEDPNINCRFYRPADDRDTFTDWSGNTSLGYQFNDQHRAYIRLASGFRAPQATELYRLQQGQERASLDSERLYSVEFGLRGQLDYLQYDVQTWLMRKRDVIFQNSDRQNISGAKTRHHGLDLDFTALMSPTLSLSGTYSYARHTYKGSINLLGTRVDLVNNDMDTAPRHTASLRIQWQPTKATAAELEWVYMGRYYTDPGNSHQYPGHELLNVRLHHELSRRFQVGIRITNLLDEDYAERADFGFGQERYFVGEPRAALVELQYLWES